MQRWVKCPDCREQIPSNILKKHILSCTKYKANLLESTTKLADHLNQGYLEFLIAQIDLAKDALKKRLHINGDEAMIRQQNRIQDFQTLFSAQKNGQKYQQKMIKMNEKQNIHLYDPTIRIENPWDDKVNNSLIDQNKQSVNQKKMDLQMRSIKVEKKDQIVRDEIKDYVQCENCKKNIDARKVDQFVYTYICFHLLCITCLKSYIDDQYVAKQGSLKCLAKECKQQIPSGQIKEIIGMEKFQQLQNQLVRKMMKGIDIVKCNKCNNQYQFAEGKPADAPKKDESGKKLSKKASEHFAKCRFLCPNAKCRSEQCRQCNASPYHLGKSCSQNQQFKLSKKCRYCKQPLKKGYTSNKGIRAFDDICPNKQCQKIGKKACSKVLKCKHSCLGYLNEKQCLPCLDQKCCKGNVKHDQNQESYCSICYIQDLKAAPCIMSKCGHIFHYHCLEKRLEVRWLTPRIILSFCLCPLCKQWLEVSMDFPLAKQITKFKALDETLKQKALKRLKHEKLENDKKLTDKQSQYYNKPIDYAMAIYAYFECFKCKKPYYGGRKNCAQAMGNQVQGRQSNQFDPTKLVCPECCPISNKDCQKHGKDFISFKCKFCCNIAQWFCWGSTHFCNDCHQRQIKGQYLSKLGKDKLPKCQGSQKCPIGGNHKPNGQQQNLGCMLCRSYKNQISDF